ncbi:hypothetical protein RB200_36710 [Streptomyces sp. PmtG]
MWSTARAGPKPVKAPGDDLRPGPAPVVAVPEDPLVPRDALPRHEHPRVRGERRADAGEGARHGLRTRPGRAVPVRPPDALVAPGALPRQVQRAAGGAREGDPGAAESAGHRLRAGPAAVTAHAVPEDPLVVTESSPGHERAAVARGPPAAGRAPGRGRARRGGPQDSGGHRGRRTRAQHAAAPR